MHRAEGTASGGAMSGLDLIAPNEDQPSLHNPEMDLDAVLPQSTSV